MSSPRLRFKNETFSGGGRRRLRGPAAPGREPDAEPRVLRRLRRGAAAARPHHRRGRRADAAGREGGRGIALPLQRRGL